MTSGSVSLKNFSWALKSATSKKRHRSGSGGSKDHEAKKQSFLSRRSGETRETEMAPLVEPFPLSTIAAFVSGGNLTARAHG